MLLYVDYTSTKKNTTNNHLEALMFPEGSLSPVTWGKMSRAAFPPPPSAERSRGARAASFAGHCRES